MAIKLKISILIFSVNFAFAQTTDSVKVRYINKGSVYKTYLYTELLSYFLKGVNINANILLDKKTKSADYVRLFVGFNKDDYKLQNYPQYPSVNRYSIALMYLFCVPLKKTVIEFGAGPAMLYGDPIARYGSANFITNKLNLQLQGSFAWRYTFKRRPYTIAVNINPTYDHFAKIKFFALPSISMGYAFKRLDYEPKKIRVYY